MTLDISFNILDQSDQLRLLKEVLQKCNVQLKSTTQAGGRKNNIFPIIILNALLTLNTLDATVMIKAGRNASHDNDNISNKMTSKVRGIAANVLAPFQ